MPSRVTGARARNAGARELAINIRTTAVARCCDRGRPCEREEHAQHAQQATGLTGEHLALGFPVAVGLLPWNDEPSHFFLLLIFRYELVYCVRVGAFYLHDAMVMLGI